MRTNDSPTPADYVTKCTAIGLDACQTLLKLGLANEIKRQAIHSG